MPARFRRCSSCRRPARAIDLEALKAHLEANVHEPPARPRSVLVIDALPVTAVGKIFKPALRDLAIKEKVRLEVERICGPGASASVEVSIDGQKRTLVEVALSGATAEQIAELEAALKPLPQTYVVRAGSRPDEAVRLAFDGRHRDADPQPARQPERGLRGDDAVAGAPASRRGRTCRACAS